MLMLDNGLSTHDKILMLADTLIQQRGFQGFSYADLEKGIGIKKASIHHHFPAKTDLGLAYCEYKIAGFNRLALRLSELPPGLQRLQGYIDTFSLCADKGEMCGVYAMLSDSHQFPAELQQAVADLARRELDILEDILITGQQQGEIRLNAVSAAEYAVIISSSIKGALMLNRLPPYTSYLATRDALITLLDGRSHGD